MADDIFEHPRLATIYDALDPDRSDLDATSLPPMQVDLVTTTANVAQAIVDPEDWESSLGGVYDVLRPGGHLAFKTRDPAYRAWRAWNRAASYRRTCSPSTGRW